MIVVIFSIYFIRQPEMVDCDPVWDYHFFSFSGGTSTQISIKETVLSEVQIFDRTFLYCFTLGVYMFFICFIFQILVHIHLRKWEQG